MSSRRGYTIDDAVTQAIEDFFERRAWQEKRIKLQAGRHLEIGSKRAPLLKDPVLFNERMRASFGKVVDGLKQEMPSFGAEIEQAREVVLSKAQQLFRQTESMAFPAEAIRVVLQDLFLEKAVGRDFYLDYQQFLRNGVPLSRELFLGHAAHFPENALGRWIAIQERKLVPGVKVTLVSDTRVYEIYIQPDCHLKLSGRPKDIFSPWELKLVE